MGERLSIVVNDPPTVGLTTEWIVEQLQHAIKRRDENNERIAALEAGDGCSGNNAESWPYHREWCRWSDIVKVWEVELFRREHHKDAKDWEEDFSHENGNYQNECCTCHQQFIGHKRRVVCKLCSEKVEQLQADSMDRLNHSG